MPIEEKVRAKRGGTLAHYIKGGSAVPAPHQLLSILSHLGLLPLTHYTPMNVHSTLRTVKFTVGRMHMAPSGLRRQLGPLFREDFEPRDYSMRSLNQDSTPFFPGHPVAHPPPIGFERDFWMHMPLNLDEQAMYPELEEPLPYREKGYLPPGLLTDDDPWCPIPVGLPCSPQSPLDEERLRELRDLAYWREQVVAELQDEEQRDFEMGALEEWRAQVVAVLQAEEELQALTDWQAQLVAEVDEHGEGWYFESEPVAFCQLKVVTELEDEDERYFELQELAAWRAQVVAEMGTGEWPWGLVVTRNPSGMRNTLQRAAHQAVRERPTYASIVSGSSRRV
ncbi:hypothetical protein C8R44DRAFT_885011 [Mycena epipterygia]|nr:hypothetical protein C8R44DRAFT_885011 [Mycena epipterygia]